VKPNSLVLATCSQSSTGGLSTATEAPGSKAPNRKPCHEAPMLRTAAS
jgi:hypothetical protein